MKISYDSEVDALYFQFIETAVTTKHLADGIAADYDEKGRLAGIEVLGVLERFQDSEVLRQIVLENVGKESVSHAI